MNGQGIFRWADGRSYNGSYKNDIKHGQGTMIWPDGKRFTGQWKEGK